VYLSTVYRPAGSTGALSVVTLAAGVAAGAAVRAVTALPVEIKWPNDLVIGRPWRKLGGVLSESAGQGARIDTVVIGVGINLLRSAYGPDLADRATSVEAELGRTVDRTWLVVELLASLREMADRLHDGQSGAICDEWRRLAGAGLGGARVRWREPDGTRRGRVRDIDRDGALLIDADGHVNRVVAGEVIWEGLSRE
jgi:BirA family biotin operon repressor/biotin-[acetyl-CoA-carboxylase] ligase